MRISLFFLMIFLFSGAICNSIAQENINPRYETIDGKTFILHPVVAGETLYSIGKKYNVEALEIVNNNPQLVSGLKAGDVLRIPAVPDKNNPEIKPAAPKPQQMLTHTVRRRETLYSISRQYKITIDDILKYNPGLTQLRRGDKIQIPDFEQETKVQIVEGKSDREVIIHEVAAGETLFAISRRYGITVQQIHDMNPDVAIIQPGMKLMIPGKAQNIETAAAVKPIEAESFIEHTISPGETLYSITRKYNVSAEQLIDLNPSLDGSFKSGTVIRIPLRQEQTLENMISHTVKKGETIYSIAKNYNVQITDIVAWNSYLEYRSIIEGDVLKLIPGEPDFHAPARYDDERTISSAECNNIRKNRQRGQAIEVVLLLPLMVDSNISMNSDQLASGFRGFSDQEILPDSVMVFRNERGPQIRFQGNSENFIHFYEGVLLAVDSLIQSGININLRVYDTEQKESRVRQLLATGRLRNADIIIGPVFPNEQKEIAEYAMKYRIPIISPLSATDDITKNNPWYFQINTPRNIINQLTAAHVAESYPEANFIILRTGNQNTQQDNEFVSLIREKVSKLSNTKMNSCDFQKSGLAGLRQLVVSDRKNVVVLTSSNEAEVSVGLSNLHTLAPSYDITVIGTNRFTQFESINQEYFHDGQLEFLAPYWPDYSKDVTNSFVRKFRNNFKTEPNQFSMQGYDVTFFFVKAIDDFGSDFRNCIEFVNPQLVQGKYRFERLPSGGFVNKGLRVVRFTRDYRVVSNEDILRK